MTAKVGDFVALAETFMLGFWQYYIRSIVFHKYILLFSSLALYLTQRRQNSKIKIFILNPVCINLVYDIQKRRMSYSLNVLMCLPIRYYYSAGDFSK